MAHLDAATEALDLVFMCTLQLVAIVRDGRLQPCLVAGVTCVLGHAPEVRQVHL